MRMTKEARDAAAATKRTLPCALIGEAATAEQMRMWASLGIGPWRRDVEQARPPRPKRGKRT